MKVCENCNEGIKHPISQCDPKCDDCFNYFGDDVEFHDP